MKLHVIDVEGISVKIGLHSEFHTVAQRTSSWGMLGIYSRNNSCLPIGRGPAAIELMQVARESVTSCFDRALSVMLGFNRS